MTWTTPADVRHQVERFWERGILPASLIGGEPLFPLRLKLKQPRSSELAARFEEVRSWIEAFREGQERGYRIVWREVNHRVLGTNRLPAELWVDTQEQALSLIGKVRQARVLQDLAEVTRDRRPELVPWLVLYPLKALEHSADWERLLDVVDWVSAHPRCGIYLRQVDLPGVDSKFIEGHKGLLSELLDLVLPPEVVDESARGVKRFCRRYGFRDKPELVRFRILDSALALFPGGTEQDISVPPETFAALSLPVRRVFITENEINFLSFPSREGAIVVFGAGYGFEALSCARWLEDCPVSYWGDIDTHGFAILDQLRARLPHVKSFLMDRETFLAHRDHWGTEPRPEIRDLPRLTPFESALYDDLRTDRYGLHLRLEQERIPWHSLGAVLDFLPS